VQAVELLFKFYSMNNESGKDKDALRKTAEDKMKSKHLFAINAEVRY